MLSRPFEIYLDNAATSNPKPEVVAEAMQPFLTGQSANPGRGSHPLANQAAMAIFDARENLLDLFNSPYGSELVFTANITEALNLSLKGWLKPGDEVLVSSMEHNSMMRPLRQLESDGIIVSVIPCCSTTGLISPVHLREAITDKTKLVAINHGSNVFGTIQPITQIGQICREHSLLFLIDSAQTAGCIDIDMDKSAIDLLAFTGHKGLLGPMGVGGLVVGIRAQQRPVTPLISGGTGSHSEHEVQPDFLPDALESGTPNLPGIAGLNAAVNWLKSTGIGVIAEQEQALCRQLLEGLEAIKGITVYAPQLESRLGVISVTVDGVDCAEVDEVLIEQFGIYCRIGLHCAPSAHKTFGTFPNGTIRLSIGAFTTSVQVDYTIEAFKRLAVSS